MTPASYVVIRYAADMIRNEPLNVGILAWNAAGFCLAIDDRATERVVQANPTIPTDSLVGLDAFLREQLLHRGPFDPAEPEAALAAIARWPIVVKEPLDATANGPTLDDLTTMTQYLVERLVAPRRRPGGGRSPADAIDRLIRPALKLQRIDRNHPIRSRLGVERRVDFYVNSGANIALDAVQFPRAKADAVVRRADSIAFKVEDLLRTDEVSQYAVVCVVSTDPRLDAANGAAQRIVRSAGAQVFTTAEEAANRLNRAVGIL